MADIEKKFSLDHDDGLQSPGLKNLPLDEPQYTMMPSEMPRWSKDSWILYLSVFCACCCAFANGYDGSLMTGMLAMPHYQSTFGLKKTTGPVVSVIFSLYTVGSMLGAPFAAILSDRYGRRKAMFTGAVVIVIGMIIMVTSKHVAQFVVGRFVLGAAISLMTVAAPAYSMEVAPPSWRSRATGLYNCGWFGGSVPAAAITFGTSYVDSNLQWQVPVILQAVCAVIVMVLVFFVPESPRYLIANGRDEEALAFLIRFHGNGNPDSPLVRFEYEEMKNAISQDGIDKRWWDYRPLFLTRGGRWRMAQVLMISVFGQFSGNGLGYFNTVIFEMLGVTTAAGQLGYNLLNQCISAFCAISAATFADRVPRRAILPLGTFICAVFLGINGGLAEVMGKQTARGEAVGDPTRYVTKAVGQGALAMYFLFNCAFSTTYTPLQGIVPVESLSTTMRAKGLAASGFIVSGMGFINQFCMPISLENIGYRTIFIFVGWDCVEAVCWYLFGVESQGKTLEELDYIYEQPNPVKASKKLRQIKVTDHGVIAQ